MKQCLNELLREPSRSDRMRQRDAGYLLRTGAEPSESISDIVSDILAPDGSCSQEKPAKPLRTFHETASRLLSNP
jgi:hypothetical protein